MSSLLSSLIRTKDFKRTSFLFVIKNETSGILIDKVEEISPGELDKSSLTLNLPSNSCSKGQKLMVYIFVDREVTDVKKSIKGKNFKGALELYTKVEKEISFEYKQSVELKIIECQESKWIKLLDKIKSIQNDVNRVYQPLSPDLEMSDSEFEQDDGKEV